MTVMTEETPMMTPISVSTVRILFAHSDCSDILNASQNLMAEPSSRRVSPTLPSLHGRPGGAVDRSGGLSRSVARLPRTALTVASPLIFPSGRYTQPGMPRFRRTAPAAGKAGTALPLRTEERQDSACKQACKPDSVEDGHSSRRRIAARAPATYPEVSAAAGRSRQQSPRGAPGRHAERPTGPCRSSLPIWSCSVWGLPCPRTLPPGRCALTAPFHPYRSALRLSGGIFSVALAVLQP